VLEKDEEDQLDQACESKDKGISYMKQATGRKDKKRDTSYRKMM
jgi:hypothetical protein